MGQVPSPLFAVDEPANPVEYLNVAATCSSTRSLGPGLRSVVWVQGCVFNCPGCVAPDWIPIRPARLVQPEELIDELLQDPRVTGITFSGGEPMLQANGLTRLARLARARRDINIICFTGFQRGYLEKTPPMPGIADLLDQVDVLIDGPYIERLNDNRGLRGSYNQRIHYLSGRLSEYKLDDQKRQADIILQEGQAMLVGVPPLNLAHAFNRAVDFAQAKNITELLRYERV
jgi:anaerobic ribonucleoside-triphosphate reductase activating protein